MTNEVQTSPARPLSPVAPTRPTHNEDPATTPGGKQPPASGDETPEASRGQQAAAEREEIERVVAELAEHARSIGRELQFEIEPNSGKTLIIVIDPDTGDVVRQIPSEEAVARARAGSQMGLLDATA